MNKTTFLIQKYNVPGPRYTSYPTVPYWESSPTSDQWIDHLRDSLQECKQEARGAAVYIHIPFCESLCTFCGCNTRITKNHNVGLPYSQTLLKEWEIYWERLSRQTIPLEDLHLGGGTPTFLNPDELEKLLNGILSHAEVSPSAQFSVEANPRVTTAEHLKSLFGLGFRRLSLGIQDFDPKVQAIVNRIQTEDQIREITDKARELGFNSVNYDLIYGLPLQTLDGIRKTIDAVNRLRPDRIAFYGFAYVPWIKAHQKRYTDEDIPGGGQKRALYEEGRSLLEKSGYREIGMDHFALKTDSLWEAAMKGSLHRNFMGYTDKFVSPLFGLGVSSIGDSWTAFSQNEKKLEAYISRIQKNELPILRGHILNEEDIELRKIILDLMTKFSASWDFRNGTSDFLQSVAERLAEPLKDEMVELTENSCRITERGKPFIRNICMAFDARLTRKKPETQIFSKTI